MSFFKFLFSKTFLINIVLAILLLLSLLWITFKYIDHYTMHGQTTTVPKLIGMNFKQARNFVKDKSLQVEIMDSVYEEKMPPGMIIDQSPKADHQVKEGRKIYLTVNYMQTPHIAMPNLVDLSLRQAAALIKSYGFKLGETTYRPNLCKNCVLQQLIGGKVIKPGTPVLKNAIVDLVLGMGKSNEKTLVPYLINSTLDEAKEKLQGVALSIGATTYDGSVKTPKDTLNAKIYKQSPIRSKKVAIQLGSAVDLWLTVDSSLVHYNPPQIMDSLKTDSNATH